MKTNKIYVVKSFDEATWHLNHYVIAFKTEDEAFNYCTDHSVETDVNYSWEEVYVGKYRGKSAEK